MSEWQDISTAPRDGTEFQAWISDVESGNPQTKERCWEPRAKFGDDCEFLVWGRTDYDMEGWQPLYGEYGPTHWQPQPDPPQ